jgi:hypothetical protein
MSADEAQVRCGVARVPSIADRQRSGGNPAHRADSEYALQYATNCEQKC